MWGAYGTLWSVWHANVVFYGQFGINYNHRRSSLFSDLFYGLFEYWNSPFTSLLKKLPFPIPRNCSMRTIRTQNGSYKTILQIAKRYRNQWLHRYRYKCIYCHNLCTIHTSDNARTRSPSQSLPFLTVQYNCVFLQLNNKFAHQMPRLRMGGIEEEGRDCDYSIVHKKGKNWTQFLAWALRLIVTSSTRGPVGRQRC